MLRLVALVAITGCGLCCGLDHSGASLRLVALVAITGCGCRNNSVVRDRVPPTLYSATDVLSGPNGIGLAMSSSGDVVCISSPYTGGYSGELVLRASGHTKLLIGWTDAGSIEAAGINDAGDVVGQKSVSTEAGGRPIKVAVELRRDGTEVACAPHGSIREGAAVSINNSSIVAGYIVRSDGSRQAASGRAGHFVGLPALAKYASSEAFSINDSMTIVGTCRHKTTDSERPFVLVGRRFRTLRPLPPGYTLLRFRVSNSGYYILSTLKIDRRKRLVYASAYAGQLNSILPIPRLQGGRRNSAHAVNSSGVIVGDSTVTGGQHHAFEYDRANLLDLDKSCGAHPGWTIFEAVDITSSGNILCNARYDKYPGSRTVILHPLATKFARQGRGGGGALAGPAFPHRK